MRPARDQCLGGAGGNGMGEAGGGRKAGLSAVDDSDTQLHEKNWEHSDYLKKKRQCGLGHMPEGLNFNYNGWGDLREWQVSECVRFTFD